jgi:hypothetical protein
VCDSIENYVTLDRIEHKSISNYGLYCPASVGSNCNGIPGRHIILESSFKNNDSEYTANLLAHEGQHADWDRDNKSLKKVLENEFISHKMEGLLIKDKKLFTETIAGNGVAGQMFWDKTRQLFEKNDGNYTLKSDEKIYFEVCENYKSKLRLKSDFNECKKLENKYN